MRDECAGVENGIPIGTFIRDRVMGYKVTAADRRGQYGLNEVAHERAPRWYVQLIHSFHNPFIYLLTALAVVSFLTDDLKATMIILSAKDLFLSQSILTGESLVVEKSAGRGPGAATQSPLELPNACFMGTNVVSGSAKAVVVATPRVLGLR